MHIIAIWNPKGGNGKSTLACNLAAAVHNEGNRAMVVDRDVQRSLADEAKLGHFPFEVVTEAPNKKPNVDFIFIDYPAQHFEELAYNEQVVITPFLPSKMDYKVYAKSLKHIKGLRQLIVLNRVDVRKREHKELLSYVRRQGGFTVMYRSVYERSFGMGTTIFDSRCDNINNVSYARNEIKNILSGALSMAKNN